MFDEETVSADVRAVQPALVVGDLRLSSQVSVRLTVTQLPFCVGTPGFRL